MSPSVDQSLRKAKRHTKKGEIDLATDIYKNVLERFPKNRRAIEGLKALQRLKDVKTTNSAGPSQEQVNGLITLYNQGRLQETLVQGEALERQFPNVPFTPNLLGAVHAALGRLDHAVESYTKALQLKPDYAEAHSNLGNAQNELGKFSDAVVSCKKALQFKPDFAEAHNNLGNALNNLGESEEAIISYKKALKFKPDYAEAHYNLGDALSDLGKTEEAVTNYGKALRLKPDYAEAHNNLGNALNDLGKIQQAIASFHEALRIKPNYAQAHYNLGNVLNGLGGYEEAIASYGRALQINPKYAQAHYNMGNALNDLGKPEEAIASYNLALQINPDYAQAYGNLGNALNDVGKPEDAIASINKALQIQPIYAEAHNNLGNSLNDLGRAEEAATSYEQALHLKPDFAEAHRNLSTIKSYHDGDPQLAQMRELIAQRNLSKEDRMHLSFALGKAYGDLGDYDSAFSYLLDGNRLRKEDLHYEISSSRTQFSNIKAVFSNNVPTSNVALKSENEKTRQPIFVLGMPRSGTTLVEQILASHSQVHGAGELGLLNLSIDAIDWNSAQITPEQSDLVRTSYLSGLSEIVASEPYITDKMPSNFRWIGFIVAAIPNAKIVHVKRDARATCWSNFKLYFSRRGMGFSYDLQDVAEYYKMYVDLMEFWHHKLPGCIYDLTYETLTENQESETRRLLEFVDLEWEDQCVEFYRTKRVVRTASVTQVRQEMYQGSSEEWRKYEKHLEPMIELLRDF